MMRRPYARLVAACALAVATASFAGGALADPGNGNSASAPGQVKQAQPAAPQPAAPQPAAQPQAPAKQQQAPGQAKKATTAQQTQSQSPGQAKKAQSSGSSSQAGIKPSSTTKHWTHTTVGASPNVS